jgi:DNA topoisomerase-1
LVGFELSPVVWRKVPGGKSAGRVQSPAVRLLVEREREIESFDSSFTFKIVAQFKHGNDKLQAELPNKFSTEDEARQFLESLINANFKVSDVTTSPASRNPGAPFTTSTLQQEANSRLGFSAKSTMSCAQKLYQEGKITYMRTDSTILSGQAIAMATNYIKDTFGEKYSQVRNFKTKSAGAQEAHEAIRPTDMSREHGSNNEYDQKIYDLIRRRTLASQMAPAQLEKTVITIKITDKSNRVSKLVFEAKGEVIIFDGFLKVYGGSKKDAEILPAVSSGDTLDLASANARQTFARPPARYSEGSLVKKLEDLGIGRPSTYATIINTVQVRGYAEKGETEGAPRDIISLSLKKDQISREIVQEKTGSDRGKLVPTPAGEVVSDFLVNHFEPIVDYGFTAKVETRFDKIATGSLARNTMLDSFYTPFHKLIENSGGIDRSTVTKAREIGIHPVTKQPILARFGRFGPMLQLGGGEADIKPQFAPMPTGRKIETVTLEEALHAFELPRTVGKTAEGATIKANIGRFGPYIQIDKLFVNIKPFDPHTITLKEALELYKAKQKSEIDKNIADFGDGLKIIKGHYGPYITNGTKNAKIPKEIDPKSITIEQAKEILTAAPSGKKRRVIRKNIRRKKA